MPISLHSWKPACGPSVTPVPRSTRKLNCAYGRWRCTAISGSFALGAGTGRGFRRAGLSQPDELVVRELELFDRDVIADRVERRPGPAAGPRSFEPPRVDDPTAGGIELLDRHGAAVVP